MVEYSYDAILERFITFSERTQDIRLVMVIGSRARKVSPADEWSDLDLVFATSDPSRYVIEHDWLSELGEYILTFKENTLDDKLVERRVLFEGGFDVDFVPLPLEMLQQGLPPQALGTIQRGCKIVLDKDNLKHVIDSDVEPLTTKLPPNPNDFQQLVNDFLYHVIWTAKKLRRGELWTAKQCCDGYLKWRLLTMIEWHTKWVSNGRSSIDVWHSGRFLEMWADSRVLNGLATSFAHYDCEEVWAALVETRNLFSLLAGEVAICIGASHSDSIFSKVDKLLEQYSSN